MALLARNGCFAIKVMIPPHAKGQRAPGGSFMRDVIDDAQELSETSKLDYVKPDLVDVGKIADVTLSNGNSGGDGGYS